MTQAKVKRTEPLPPRVPPALILFALMVAATIAAGVWAMQLLSDPTALPIRRVMVEGEFKHLTPEHVQSAVVSAVHGGFFGVKVDEIRSLLLDDPWIRRSQRNAEWRGTVGSFRPTLPNPRASD